MDLCGHSFAWSDALGSPSEMWSIRICAPFCDTYECASTKRKLQTFFFFLKDRLISTLIKIEGLIKIYL